MPSCGLNRRGGRGAEEGHTPVGGREGTRLAQSATQVGTEASEQGEGEALVRAGPRKVEEDPGGLLGPIGSLQG